MKNSENVIQLRDNNGVIEQNFYKQDLYKSHQSISSEAEPWSKNGNIDLDSSGTLIIHPTGLPKVNLNLYTGQAVALILNVIPKEICAINNNGLCGYMFDDYSIGKDIYVFGDLGKREHLIFTGNRKFLVQLISITSTSAEQENKNYLYNFSITEQD